MDVCLPDVCVCNFLVWVEQITHTRNIPNLASLDQMELYL